MAFSPRSPQPWRHFASGRLYPGPAQTTNEFSLRTLPQVIVTGTSRSLHDVTSESDLVGPANQPEWTTRRAFAETDIYVIPPGEIEFNQFYISSHPRQGKPENLFESEFEFGLPWRSQVDVEVNYSLQNGNLQHDAMLVEIPHALADWGKIPLNPTVDAGWRFNTESADAYFFRLLLGVQQAVALRGEPVVRAPNQRRPGDGL